MNIDLKTLDDDALLSATQVAEIFGVERRTVLTWAMRGQLPAQRFTKRTIRFRAADVRAHLAGAGAASA